MTLQTPRWLCLPITLISSIGGFLFPLLWVGAVGFGTAATIGALKREPPSKGIVLAWLAAGLIGMSIGGWLGWGAPQGGVSLVFVGFVAGATGGAFISAVMRIAHRVRRIGNRSMPVRSVGLAIASTLIAMAALGPGLWGCFEIEESLGSTPMLPIEGRASAQAAGVVGIATGIFMLAAGSTSMFFLVVPSKRVWRVPTMAAVVAAILTTVYPLLAYRGLNKVAQRSHSAGAGVGAMLFLVLLPVVFILLDLVVVVCLISVRKLVTVANAEGGQNG